jgi:hypothetical protein
MFAGSTAARRILLATSAAGVCGLLLLAAGSRQVTPAVEPRDAGSPPPAKRTAGVKVLALGVFARPLTDEQRKRILPKEVPDTLRLYLDGKIDQFWFREDKPGGVVFLMNSTSVEEARSIVEALPLAANGYLVFEYIPVGPLRPLGLLIESPQPE